MSREKINIVNSFSDRLRQLIADELKITQAEFAKNIGTSEGYLSSILNQGKGPSADIIAGIFLKYREYLDWLVTGTKPERREEMSGAYPIREKQAAYAVADPHANEILRMTREVIESKTVYAEALERNVVAFHRAVSREALDAMDVSLEQRVKQLVEHELRVIKGRDDPPGERSSDASRKNSIAADEPPEGPK